MFLDEATIGPVEQDVIVGGPLDTEAAFVGQPVVMAAEQHEIVDRGVAALRPVADVMLIDETAMVTARKTATAVACLQGTAHRRRHGPGLASDIEGIACVVFRYP